MDNIGIMLVMVIPGWGEVDPYLAGRACMIQAKYDSALILSETGQ